MLFKALFGVYRMFIPNVAKFFSDSEKNDDWGSPLYWLIGFPFSEFLGVAALLVSFWYGLSRKKRVIESRDFKQDKNRPSSESLLETLHPDDEDFEEDDPEYAILMTNPDQKTKL